LTGRLDSVRAEIRQVICPSCRGGNTPTRSTSVGAANGSIAVIPPAPVSGVSIRSRRVVRYESILPAWSVAPSPPAALPVVLTAPPSAHLLPGWRMQACPGAVAQPGLRAEAQQRATTTESLWSPRAADQRTQPPAKATGSCRKFGRSHSSAQRVLWSLRLGSCDRLIERFFGCVACIARCFRRIGVNALCLI
jgi:hypothetical protein